MLPQSGINWRKNKWHVRKTINSELYDLSSYALLNEAKEELSKFIQPVKKTGAGNKYNFLTVGGITYIDLVRKNKSLYTIMLDTETWEWAKVYPISVIENKATSKFHIQITDLQLNRRVLALEILNARSTEKIVYLDNNPFNLTKANLSICTARDILNAYLETVRKTRKVVVVYNNLTHVTIIRRNGEEHILIVDNITWEWLQDYDIWISHGYCKVADKNGGSILLHRLLLDAQEGDLVDHINGNPLLNTFANIRLCNALENAQNRKVSSNSKTGIRGVCYNTVTKKWQAKVVINGTATVQLYNTVEEAAEVVKEFRKNNMPFSKEARGL